MPRILSKNLTGDFQPYISDLTPPLSPSSNPNHTSTYQKLTGADTLCHAPVIFAGIFYFSGEFLQLTSTTACTLFFRPNPHQLRFLYLGHAPPRAGFFSATVFCDLFIPASSDGFWVSPLASEDSPYYAEPDPSVGDGHLRSCPADSGGVGVGGSRVHSGDGRLAGSRRIRVGSWNVGSLTGKLFELADVLGRHKVDIACFQETKWKGSSTREGNGYKLWYSGFRSARNGVGVILAAGLKDNVVQVIMKGDRTMKITLVIDVETVNVISAYASQVGRSDVEKRSFWDSLDELVRECPADQRMIIGGDLNCHIGATTDEYAGVHGGFGYGVRNVEGCSILEFATAHNLVVANSFFKKRDVRACKDCRVFPGEACSSQHKLVPLDAFFQRCRHGREATGMPRILWKKLNGYAVESFRAKVSEGFSARAEDLTTYDADQMWNTLAYTIRDAAKDSLGMTSGSARTQSTCRESWWFSEEVQIKVVEKQARFKEFLLSRESDQVDRAFAEEKYKVAKREAKKALAVAKDKVYEDLYKKLDSKEGANDIFRIAKARERRRRDLGNIKYIKDEVGRPIVNEEGIRKRWESISPLSLTRGTPKERGTREP
ncbi:hypothetical protein CTI12_AA058500 [Artemisia annua]|uniref:Endonuclease/exonuclease/phosphatase domain-containing protein n=1 Tax=Artemisia annua TaxID=35608 RepID=A0A2U1NZY0_ARTAN|nr:hypothetical protein CTI12_AA058500 [Artemisia annua]